MIPEDDVAQSFKTLEHFRRSLVLMFNKSLWHCPSHEQVPWYALGQVPYSDKIQVHDSECSVPCHHC